MPVIVTIKVGSPINEEDARVLGSLAIAFAAMGAPFSVDPSTVPDDEDEDEQGDERIGHLFGPEVN